MGSHLASYIEVRNEEVMVFFRAGLAHVPFYLPPSLLPESGRAFGHRKQAKVILGNQKDVKPVQCHS